MIDGTDTYSINEKIIQKIQKHQRNLVKINHVVVL